jgi:uncharacterized membrane protein (DUF373 family)
MSGDDDSDADSAGSADGGTSRSDGGLGQPRADETGPFGRLSVDDIANVTDGFINVVEVVAAAVFAFLFAVGVVDLSIQIVDAIRSGSIVDPDVVISFIDTGLLLLIIVEVYQTVIAYTREDDTGVIVRLVIYTGVIAIVRKIIIFRTSEYETVFDALLVAGSYTVIIAGLVGLLFVDRLYSRRSTGGDGSASAE